MSWLKRKSKKQEIQKTREINEADDIPINEIDEDKLHELFHGCSDVVIQKYNFGNNEMKSECVLSYCSGICDTKQINETVLGHLHDLYKITQFKSTSEIDNNKNFPITIISGQQPIRNLVLKVFDGELVIYFSHAHSYFSIDIADPPQRIPSEPNTEVSIRGPKDGFVEEIDINIALIRKRLKTTSLKLENYVIGKRSGTRICLLYIDDVINMQYIEEARQRIQRVDIDIVVSSNELEDILGDSSYSIFPLLDYTGRPDYAVQCLTKGRFIMIVEGSPTVSIAPANLFLLTKAPEDASFNFLYVSFARLLRLVGFIISLLLPGFYISLIAYHPDQLPFFLLATIANSRIGIPLTAAVEIYLIMGLYELFREAGVRLPKAVGQTLTVVGGIVIGDAAIRSGLTSPSMVVIASLVAVSRYTLVNQISSGTITVLSLIILGASTFLGFFGFFVSTFAVLLLLANLKSFGLPFLSPISPIKLKDVLSALISLPWKNRKKRPDMLNTLDTKKQGDNS